MARLHSAPRAARAAARTRPVAGSIAPRTPEQLQESRAHHEVFADLSGRYQEHCRRSGQAESPALCAAADRFRQERTLASLLRFVDCLDQLDIPARTGKGKPWA